MLRLPSPREIGGLFVASRTTAGATKVLSDTSARLQDVIDHHELKAGEKYGRASEHRCKARNLESAAQDHLTEANRANAVAAKLSALLS